MLEVIKKSIKNNINASHAFLIGNVDFKYIKEELDELINHLYFNNAESIYNNPDVIVINEGEEREIKKDSIINMQKSLICKSQFNENKVYIIINAEDLNDTSANKILKLLEEPEENIFAFLLSKNINKVLPTIKSRCKCFFLQSEINVDSIYKKYDKRKINNLKNYVLKIEESKLSAYLINTKKMKDKNKIKEIIDFLPYVYKDCINYVNGLSLEHFIEDKEFIKEITSKNDNDKLIKKLLIVNDILEDLNYNLNKGACFDKIVIEFWR